MENKASSEQQFVQKLNEIVNANLHNEQFGVSELAREMKMSRVSLHRKVKSITKISASKFISRVRLRKALELLQQNAFTISETAYECGFNSVTYFSKCFHDYFGYPPGEANNHIITENNIFEINEVKPLKTKKSLQITLNLLLSFIFINVLVTGGAFYFILNKNDNKDIEKSIAVLPFINDSSDSTNVYFINGITDAILNNLSAIKDLRIVSRNSVEKYRNNRIKSTPEIARELGVNYIVEGSAQRIDDHIKLTVQLIDAKKDKHLFSQPYERDIEEIFVLQSEIAISVASKINAFVTPEEVEKIEQKPTKNIAALNMYLRGLELSKVGKSEKNISYVQNAKNLYKKAIQLDSAYADAYISLAWDIIYISNDIDSGLYLANRALHFDPKNPGALGFKGWALMQKGLFNESEAILKQAIKYNPKNSTGYDQLGTLYFVTGRYSQSVEYALKALKLQEASKDYLYQTLRGLSDLLCLYGFSEDALKFAETQIEYFNDSLSYYEGLTAMYLQHRNFPSAYQNSLNALNWNKGEDSFWNPHVVALYLEDYKNAVVHIEELAENIKFRGLKLSSGDYNYYGYAYLKNGQKEKADYYFTERINDLKNELKTNEQNHYTSCSNNFSLACIYSAMGDKEKATENMRKAAKCGDILHFYPCYIDHLKTLPQFEIIRNQPEFQKLINDIEAWLQPHKIKIEKHLKDYWNEN